MPDRLPPRFVKVGQIVAAHGIRGQVKLRSFAEKPENIASYGPLCDGNGSRRFALRLHGQAKGLLIASLEGVTDRNQAETLKGMALYISAETLPPLTGQRWYADTLVGLRVQTPDGTPLGSVAGVHNYGAGDIMEIAFSGGANALFPFRDAFFPEINAREGYISFLEPEILE